MKKVYFLLLFLFVVINSSRASHVVGGNLEMVALDNVPGHFRLALNLYFDNINQDVGGLPNQQYFLGVYRKSDNKTLYFWSVDGISGTPVIYTNQVCATKTQIKTTLYRYEKIVNWSPSEFSDPEGYYLTWQSCCRNGVISNIQRPIDTGQTFFLEFSPLLKNGKPFINSSPVFQQVNGEFICVNEPFYFSFEATDNDGDELRYSLTTPLDQLDPNRPVPGAIIDRDRVIKWLPGYSATNAIPGNPPLSINPTTGELTVTASQTGLFVFTVVVDEYRHGERIGSVRRDYQLYVIDCPPIIPPDPVVTINNQLVSEAQFCVGKTAELQATVNSTWDYQWQKDGRNIPGAIKPNLSVTESGKYLLTTTLKTQCSKARRSRNVQITFLASHVKLKTQTAPYLCGANSTVKIDAPTGNNLTYEWYFDNKIIPEITSTLLVNQSGQYWAIVRDNSLGCQAVSDTVRINSAQIPVVSITPQRATTAICSGDSLTLSTVDKSNYTYQWAFNGIDIAGATNNHFVAHQLGQYTLKVTDTTYCQALTDPFNLNIVNTIPVTLDSIPAFCSPNNAAVPLKGQPEGGSFSGPGVSGSLFNPLTAGVGIHTVMYTLNSTFVCQNGTATRSVTVRSPPDLNLGPDLEIGNGSSVQLQSGLSSEFLFRWEPASSLNDPTIANPEATPQQTTNYILIAKDKYGCTITDSIVVYVYERIWIPDAFSPNGDGLNENWELRGIESYPQAEIAIFNRWGEIVFFSRGYKKAFDGQYLNESLPAGVYAYKIKPSPTRTTISGSLTILR